MTTKVISLIGASGGGKTTIAKELENKGYNVIQSYTTRPPRYENEWGHTFIEDCFVSYNPNDSIHYISEGLSANSKTYWAKDMIAYFNSYNSGHHYFATDEQVIRGKTNIYIVDPRGAEMVKDYYKDTDVEVITIYLQVDEDQRRKRIEEREGLDYIKVILNNKYAFSKQYIDESEMKEDYFEYKRKVHNRIDKDRDLFQTVKCDYAVDANPELNTVLANIEKIIEVGND